MMMKDAFYLFFKARFVLKIFAFLLKMQVMQEKPLD